MNNVTSLLYGELVAMPQEAEMTSAQEEMEAIKEQRRLMIEEAAFYLAEKRGFTPGYELQDWLNAETQIEGTKPST